MHVCDLMVTFLRSGLKGKRHEEKGSDKSIGTEADGRGGENGQADYYAVYADVRGRKDQHSREGLLQKLGVRMKLIGPVLED